MKISSYPILKDIGNGIVTQAKHTVMITGGGCEKLT
jgi:methionine aminopeptidase